MIRKIRIENYKSIPDLDLELGRVTVMIGENGCGKSNILEAIALGAASAQRKLGNEFLASRGIRVTDQRSANEGFLLLLFYVTLLISPDTPAFFAVDNVDTSLNPKLCSALVNEFAELTSKQGKQVILTTHNPAILDGLDLHDDEQRLLVVFRNKEGHTKVRRVHPPQPVGDEPPMRLSEAFLRGFIGGLPKNF